MEVWKPLVGYENQYEISSFGRVRSLLFDGNTILKHDIAKGYHRVTLFKNGKRNRKMVHILVAKTFIPNPCDKPCVNHIDENKDNNTVENLEWCTPKENCNHGNRNRTISRKVSKPVAQLSKDGETIKIWDSMTEASNTLGIALSEISACTRNYHKTAGGYKWRYTNERH